MKKMITLLLLVSLCLTLLVGCSEGGGSTPTEPTTATTSVSTTTSATSTEPSESKEPLPLLKPAKYPLIATKGMLMLKLFGDTYALAAYSGTATTVSIPDTYRSLPVTTVGAEAFAGNTTVTRIVIPASVTKLDATAFAGCTALTQVVFLETEGWQVDGTPIDVTSATNNAAMLTALRGDWVRA